MNAKKRNTERLDFGPRASEQWFLAQIAYTGRHTSFVYFIHSVRKQLHRIGCRCMHVESRATIILLYDRRYATAGDSVLTLIATDAKCLSRGPTAFLVLLDTY